MCLRGSPLASLGLRDIDEHSNSCLSTKDTREARKELDVFGMCFRAVTGCEDA